MCPAAQWQTYGKVGSFRMTGHQIVCLLPARNVGSDLPDYLDSASRFCDAIVALDDGSTDDTAEILAAHPLVKILLREPRRETYAGWDDGRNRNRLLEATAELDPQWVISVDADERMDPSDAAALRDFISYDAIPACAYQFRIFRMAGDLEHYDPNFLWVCRLHGFEPGQRIPDRGLHMVPIPSSISPQAWLQTTLRIQHIGGSTKERRLARYSKYREADPQHKYQTSYEALLNDPPTDPPRWLPRPPNLPVLLSDVQDMRDWELDRPHPPDPSAGSDGPALSAIVISHNDEAVIERTVTSVLAQQCPEPFEVIVVTSGTDRTAEVVAERFPRVRLISLPGTALPGKARNAGLRLARGEFVTFPGSHVELPSGSLAARLRAHREGYVMVTGSVVNGTATWAGWASYFMDHCDKLPGSRREVLQSVPASCSYRRDALVAVGAFPEDVRTGEDTDVNMRLCSRGFHAVRDPAIRFIHHSPCATPKRLVSHHFTRGRGLGRLLFADRLPLEADAAMRIRYLRRFHKKSVREQLRWIHGNVWRNAPERRLTYVRAFPLIVLGVVAYWSGVWWEAIRPRTGGDPTGESHS